MNIASVQLYVSICSGMKSLIHKCTTVCFETGLDYLCQLISLVESKPYANDVTQISSIDRVVFI